MSEGKEYFISMKIWRKCKWCGDTLSVFGIALKGYPHVCSARILSPRARCYLSDPTELVWNAMNEQERVSIAIVREHGKKTLSTFGLDGSGKPEIREIPLGEAGEWEC